MSDRILALLLLRHDKEGSMKFIRIITLTAILGIVLSGCGRRLSDEYFDTNTDFADVEDTVEVVVEVPTVEAEVTVEVSTDNTTSDEVTDTVDDVAEEPQFVLVEAPADPIIELVANADPVNGEALFNSGLPCTSCHLVDSEDSLVGPGLLNIPQRAETRIEGEVAERYLYTSIILPNDFIVDGFAGAMPPSYPDSYTEEEIHDIVAYLMTLGAYPEREPQFIEVPVEVSDTVEEETVEEVEATEEVAVIATDVTDESEATEEPATDDENVVVIIVTATPIPEVEVEVEATEEPETVEETVEMVDEAFTPAFDLDYSNVPDTIDSLAEFGSETLGEALFNEGLVFSTSCADCHSLDGTGESDLSQVGAIDDAASYIWASIYSTEVHPDYALSYSTELTAADTAHLIAYLIEVSEGE